MNSDEKEPRTKIQDPKKIQITKNKTQKKSNNKYQVKLKIQCLTEHILVIVI